MYNARQSDKRDDYQTIAYLALSECRIEIFSVPRDTQTLDMLPPDITCVEPILNSVTRTLVSYGTFRITGSCMQIHIQPSSYL